MRKLFIMIGLMIIPQVYLRAQSNKPSWSVNPSAFQYNMELTARIKISDATITSGGMVAGFVGNECRGVKDLGAMGPGGYVFIVFIYSNTPIGETITFKFYDSTSDKVYNISETAPFTSDAQLGNAVNPRILNCVIENQSTLMVTPDSRNLVFTKGSITIGVSNSGGGSMDWNAIVNSGMSWTHITAGSTGTNSGTITVTVDSNPGSVQRTSSITVTANGATGSPKVVTLVQGFNSGIGHIFVIESQLPSRLVANAGEDKSISLGDSVQLGNIDTGSGGYGNFTYLWSPSNGLSNPTSANPWAKPRGKSVYNLTVTDFHNCTSVDQVLVSVSGTGTSSLDLPISIQAFPNPAHGVVTLYMKGFSGNGNVRVVNVLGQKVFQQEVQLMNELKFDIDVSLWQNGLYYFVIQSDTDFFTKRIIVF